jgi:hypothetical protein
LIKDLILAGIGLVGSVARDGVSRRHVVRMIGVVRVAAWATKIASAHEAARSSALSARLGSAIGTRSPTIPAAGDSAGFASRLRRNLHQDPAFG